MKNQRPNTKIKQTFSESVVMTTEDFCLLELHFRFLVPGVGGLLPELKVLNKYPFPWKKDL